MDYRKYTKRELADILDIIHAALACRSDEDIVKVVSRVKDLVSADRGICGIGIVESGVLSRVIRIINLDYPGEWINMYAARELYKQDPVVLYNCENFKTYFWSEAIRAYADSPQVTVMNMAGDFGLRHGLAGGLGQKENNLASLFSFSSDTNRFKNRHREILDLLMPHIHQALSRVNSPSKKRRENLSAREKEVLRWMMEGKTNWEISMILNISERTVKFHVQNIERKLEAVNKAHAIALAMDSGLVA